MMEPKKAQVLRIYIGEGHNIGNVPLWEELVYRARSMKMAGASVLKSPFGFGEAELSGTRNYRVANDPAVIREFVDTAAHIAAFLPIVREALKNHGMITLHETSVIHYGKDDPASFTAS